MWRIHAQLGDRIVLVGLGALDEGERLVPDDHCYTGTKHPWVVLPDGVPAYAAGYDTAAV